MESLIESHLLLKQACDEMEVIYMKKRNRKLSRNKRRRRLVSPTDKSPDGCSGSLNTHRTITSIKSSRRRKKSKTNTKSFNSYNTSRIISPDN